MKKFLLVCVAGAALMGPAAAADVPTLSQFLMNCDRDVTVCRLKLQDYITASTQQNLICLPKDVSVREASSQTLRWLRDVGTKDDKLYSSSYDDAVWQAISTMWPCKPDSSG